MIFITSETCDGYISKLIAAIGLDRASDGKYRSVKKKKGNIVFWPEESESAVVVEIIE